MTIKHKSFVWVCKKENKLRGKRSAREREREIKTKMKRRKLERQPLRAYARQVDDMTNKS